MARAKFKDVAIHERIPQKTCIGRRPKNSSMNKYKKISWKAYHKQGR